VGPRRACDSQERYDMEAGMAKYFASEAGMGNALESIWIRGACDCSNAVERYFRDALLLLISEAANKLQRVIIARQLLAQNPVSR
jgi:alkylation response protein AidB-like acyl-CoA dehydrogenase